MKSQVTGKSIYIFSIFLLFLLGISALAGGWEMIRNPSGNTLGWSTDMLKYSPFRNYMIPGIVLFVILGIVSLSIAVLVIKKIKDYSLLIMGQGSILLLWIIIQVIFIWRFNILHGTCVACGILLVSSGFYLMKKEI